MTEREDNGMTQSWSWSRARCVVGCNSRALNIDKSESSEGTGNCTSLLCPSELKEDFPIDDLYRRIGKFVRSCL